MFANLYRFRHSIVTRIVALGLGLAVLGIVVRIAAIHWLLRPELRQMVAEHQLAAATQTARDVDGQLVRRQALVGQLAKTLPTRLLARPVELAGWLAERQALDPLFSQGLIVVSPTGEALIAETPAMPGRASWRYREADWLAAARDSRKPAIGRPGGLPGAAEPALVVAAPVQDGDGRVVAVLAGVTALAAPGFLDQVQAPEPGSHTGLFLVSPRDRLFVAASEPDKRLAPLPAPGTDAALDRAMAGESGSALLPDAQGNDELVSVVPVPGAGWFLVSRIAAEKAFRVADKTFTLVLLNSGVIVLAVSFVLAFVLRRIFRPLIRGARQARAMANGDMPLQPLPVYREDEVGEMNAAFNYLLRKLQDKEADLLRTMDELRDREARLEYLAHHDPLTGLPNRILLSDRLEQALARAVRTGRKLALLFLDLDGFKLINDSHGHDIGDVVLEQVAVRLLGELRQVDTVARMGGDEFIVLLADVEDASEAAEKVAKKCIEAMRKPFVVGGLPPMQLGVSVGIACYPEHGRSALSLLAHSDQAMYRAKQKGRNRYESPEPAA